MTSLIEIYRRFPDREAATAHLEQVRWPDGPTCPQCGADTVSRKAEKGQMDRLQCWSCERSFSATVGTIFHNSHIDLQRWFLLISLMLNAKKGLSAMQAARDLEMRRPTVWSMMHRIRAALAIGSIPNCSGHPHCLRLSDHDLQSSNRPIVQLPITETSRSIHQRCGPAANSGGMCSGA